MDPTITMLDIDALMPYENNPRHNDDAVEPVARSIEQFGFKVPMVISRDGTIVTGHTRYKAAKKLGLEKVPCIIADDLTDEQLRAFRIIDNKTAEFASWDDGLLQIEIDGLDVPLDGFGLECDIDFADFDGSGDGGGSMLARGGKVRVVIGSLMFDLDDPDHELYEKTQDLEPEIVGPHIVDALKRDRWR